MKIPYNNLVKEGVFHQMLFSLNYRQAAILNVNALLMCRNEGDLKMPQRGFSGGANTLGLFTLPKCVQFSNFELFWVAEIILNQSYFNHFFLNDCLEVANLI